MMRKARRWYFKHSKGADLGNVLRFLIWQPDRSNRDGPQAILCDASAWWWPLTRRASFAGEYEKADPNRGRCGIPDDSARQAALPERGAFRNYWPFRGVRTHPQSTKRTRKLVADKFGSPSRIRTHNLLVDNQIGNDRPAGAFLRIGLAIPHAKSNECVHDRKRSKHKHADGNEVPSPSHPGGVGLAVRRLGGVLVGGMGQIPPAFSGDGGEGPSPVCNRRRRNSAGESHN